MEDDIKKQMQEVLAPFRGRQGVLIPALQAVQRKFSYLPEMAMEEIGQAAGMSANTVYGVASFYSQFRFVKPGEHMIKVCLGTACHVQGAAGLVDAIQRKLAISPGETSLDEKFSLEEVRCFGSCALAPVVVLDDDVYGNMTTTKTEELLEKYQQLD